MLCPIPWQTDAGGRQTNINCNCKWREMSECLNEWMNERMNEREWVNECSGSSFKRMNEPANDSQVDATILTNLTKHLTAAAAEWIRSKRGVADSGKLPVPRRQQSPRNERNYDAKLNTKRPSSQRAVRKLRVWEWRGVQFQIMPPLRPALPSLEYLTREWNRQRGLPLGSALTVQELVRGKLAPLLRVLITATAAAAAAKLSRRNNKSHNNNRHRNTEIILGLSFTRLQMEPGHVPRARAGAGNGVGCGSAAPPQRAEGEN